MSLQSLLPSSPLPALQTTQTSPAPLKSLDIEQSVLLESPFFKQKVI